MSLQDEINTRIKEEIDKDPDSVGYAGKTDAEIMELLNSPVRKERVVVDSYPPPINKILSGLALAPNVVAETDIVASKIII